MTGGTFTADTLAAFRRLRRKLSLWRTLAIVAIVAAVAALFWEKTDGGFGEHIARVRISGLITGNQRLLDLLDSLKKSKKVKAVIVRIDSPGGTTVGSEAVFHKLRQIAAKKPVVAVMDSVAASGGYITAIAADRIYARENTITGSIGVIFQWAEVHDLLSKLGVKMNTLKSGPLKAQPNPFEPLTPEAKRVTEELVRQSYDWFVALVAKRRGLDRDAVLKLADGRVYLGKDARSKGLIDAIGDEEAAKDWLVKEKGLKDSLKIVERKPKKLPEELGLGFSLIQWGAKFFGFDAVLERGQFSQGLALDGLLALWHPRLQYQARGSQ
ncbi:signal peptide peptidase SppA [Thermopetrobacter sp. TC1]|uniref:signal peptide peptidase SppA n=1 Tax=Thermopetrobacter sp. TC1 TaxID=1495045 RepID=UPI00056FBFFF|nr:signal peptide peptidase SppA [Thermopetrobacter sp. TC1]